VDDGSFNPVLSRRFVMGQGHLLAQQHNIVPVTVPLSPALACARRKAAGGGGKRVFQLSPEERNRCDIMDLRGGINF